MADVEIRFGADTSELQAAFARAEKSLSDLSSRVQSETGNLASMSTATRRVLDQYDRQPATLAKVRDAYQAVNEAVATGEMTGKQAIRALDGIAKQSEKTGEQLEKTGGQAGIFREKMVLLHEAVTGSTTRMAGSMMVLAERTGSVEGAFKALLTRTTLVIGALAAAVGSLATMVLHAERAAAVLGHVSNVLSATGDSGRLAGEQISRAVESLQHLPDVTREAAEEIVIALSRTRQMSGPVFEQVVQLVGRFSEVMGADAPSAARELAAAIASPQSALEKLNGTTLEVSVSTSTQIEEAVRMGDTARASSLLIGELESRLRGVNDRVTPLSRSVHELRIAFENLLSSPGVTDLGKTIADQLAYASNAWAGYLGSTRGQIGYLTEAIRRQKERIAEVQVQMAAGQIPAHPIEGYIQRLRDLEGRLEAARLAQDTAASIHHSTSGAAKSRPTVVSTSGDGVSDDDRVKRALTTGEQFLSVKQQQARIDQQMVELSQALAVATGKEREEFQQMLATARERRDALADQSGGETQMEGFRRELAERQAADKRGLEDRKADDLAFWQEKLAGLKTGEKEYAQVYGEIAKLQRDIDRQTLADVLANMESQRAAAQRGSEERVAIAKAEADVIKAAPGTSTKAIEEANRRIEEMEREHVAVMRQIDEDRLNTTRQLAEDIISRERESLDFRKSMGEISASEEIAQLRALSQQQYEIESQTLANRLTLGGLEIVERERISNQLLALESRHASEIERLDQQAARARLQSIQQWTQPIKSANDSVVSGYLQGTLTASQAAARAAQSIAISYISTAAHIAQDWIEKHVLMAAWESLFATKTVAAARTAEAMKTSATTAGTAARTAEETASQAGFFARIGAEVAGWLGLETSKTAETTVGAAARTTESTAESVAAIASAKIQASAIIPAETAIAAMGAASAVASIPFVGPAMAAAAATEMSVMGAGYLAMASAARGWDRVPEDGALTELHRDEMVMSAPLASGIRDLIALPSALRTPAAMAPVVRTLGSLSLSALRPPPALQTGALSAPPSRGDVTMHFAPTINAGKTDLESLLMSQGSALKKWIRSQIRNGDL